MSDQYQEYEEYQEYANEQGGNQYQQMQQQAEEDYQTKVELDYFEAESLLRNNQIQKYIALLEELYAISTQKNFKDWKIKILNSLLQIYCRSNQNPKIKQTLERISDLNKQQKYTQNSIKSIIMTIKSLPVNSFNANKQFLYNFISQLDNLGKIRSYLLFLQKAVEQNDIQETERLFQVIRQILAETPFVPPSNMIQLFSFQIRHSKKTKKDISKEIRKMQLKLSSLEAQSYMTEGHISIIKEAVAQSLYIQDNFKDCAIYLCEAFQDNMKYGKNNEVKKTLLKANVLVALLTEDKQAYTTDKINSLYHESASSFKSENDIQSLYGMVQAFMDCDLNSFIDQSKIAQLNFNRPYENLLECVVIKLKMSKLLQIIRPYTTIKSEYLQRRLNSSKAEVEKMLFSLITDNKIQGRIRKEQKQTYLDIIPAQQDFLRVQLQNIRQISKRYV